MCGTPVCLRRPLAISRTWVVDQFNQAIAPAVRLRLLAGRPGTDVPERGRIVCACLDVGRNEIIHAIVAKGCTTVAAVGALREGWDELRLLPRRDRKADP